MAIDWKNNNDATIFRLNLIVFFFDIVVFFLSSLITGPRFMLMSLLDLDFWQFLFVRDWPKIRKSEILLSEFCLISGDRKFVKNVSNEKLLDAAKCQVYYFYHFWVIKEKTTSRIFRATHTLMSGLELSRPDIRVSKETEK